MENLPAESDFAGNRFQNGVPDMPVKDYETALRYYIDALGFKKFSLPLRT